MDNPNIAAWTGPTPTDPAKYAGFINFSTFAESPGVVAVVVRGDGGKAEAIDVPLEDFRKLLTDALKALPGPKEDEMEAAMRAIREGRVQGLVPGEATPHIEELLPTHAPDLPVWER